jgi:hypothetical protein
MPSDAEGVRLRAEAVRLQMAHLRAVRTGDATAASSFLEQIRRNNELLNRIPIEADPSPSFNPYERMYSPEYESMFDPADFVDAEDIAASTVRRTPPTARSPQFQNFLNNINTQSPQSARIQEFVNKNPQLAEKIFNTSSGLRSKVSGTQKKLAGISNNIYQAAENFRTKYHDGSFIPDFIANPLGLNNPLVEAGGLIEEGTRLNRQGLTFLKEQRDLGPVLNRRQLDAMGGKVTANYFSRNRANPQINIAFQSATGYTDFKAPLDIQILLH